MKDTFVRRIIESVIGVNPLLKTMRTTIRLTAVLCANLLLFPACGDVEVREQPSSSRDSAVREVRAANPSDSISAEAAVASDTAAATDTASPDAAPADATLPKGRRYNVASGILEYTSSLIGNQKQTVYFDDYGQREAVHSTVQSGNDIQRTIMVMTDGVNVVYDPDRKAGTRIDLSDALSQMGLGGIPNLSSLTSQQRVELKFAPIAGRVVLGKKTEGASIEVAGTPVKVWSWEGIPLRMEATIEGRTMTVEATSLKTDVAIARNRFVVPSDVTLRDLTKTK